MKKLKYEELPSYPAEKRKLIIEVGYKAIEEANEGLEEMEMKMEFLGKFLWNERVDYQAALGIREAREEKNKILERLKMIKHNLDIVEKYEKELKEHKSDDETLNKKVLH